MSRPLVSFLLFLLWINSFAAKPNCPDYKTLICHAGSEINPHYVNVCVSFSSVWGHLAEHEMDYYGECRLKDLKAPYACNAGLLHKESANEVCFIRDGDSKDYVASCDGQKNCYCSSGFRNFEYDFMDYKIADFDPFSEFQSDFINKVLQGGEFDYNHTSDNPPYSKLEGSGSFSFNLGSERTDARYFVDMCWTNTTGMESYEIPFQSVMRVVDYNGDYLQDSRVLSHSEVYCDNVFDGDLDFHGAHLVQKTNPYPFSISDQKVFDFEIRDSEFCYLRHYFKETKPNRMRKWEKSSVTIHAELESKEIPFVDGPHRICHVKALKKNPNNGLHNQYGDLIGSVNLGCFENNNHQCCQLEFQNSDHIKSYVKEIKSKNDFRFIHQHDYIGNCRATCGPIHGNGAN